MTPSPVLSPALPHTLPTDLPTGLWLGGEQVSTAATFPVRDPATGEVLTEVADATPEDGLRALDLAVAAQAEWAATPPRKRADILARAFDAVHDRADDFARIMTLEMGKTLAEARGEVNYGAEFLRWFAEEAVRIGGRTATAPAGTGRIVVTKGPVGPVLAITPWNFPLAMATRKIGPALAAGCPIIVKPASETPLTMLLLGKVFADAGLPKGVLSILPTSHASALTDPLIADARLRKITFTGSTGIGKHHVRASADRLLRTSMELGGNAPFLVFDDADIDAAVEGAVAAKMRNGGEACTAANRFLVQESIAEDFTARLTEAMAAVRVGNGFSEGAQLGPLINAAAREKIERLVADAVDRGARVRTGGERLPGPGYFYPPTVIDRVQRGSAMLAEEVFGPVAPVMTFGDDDEALALANDTEHGLVAFVFSRDLRRAMAVGEEIETGMVGLNRGVVSDPAAPFGGAKQSGIGREGGHHGLLEFLEPKYFAFD